MKKLLYIVKLSDGEYIGNTISGKNIHHFVKVERAFAARFNSHDFAYGAAKSYKLTGFSIEPTNEE